MWKMKNVYWVESGDCWNNESKFFGTDRENAEKFARMMWGHYTEAEKKKGMFVHLCTAEVPSHLEDFDLILEYCFEFIGGFNIEKEYMW